MRFRDRLQLGKRVQLSPGAKFWIWKDGKLIIGDQCQIRSGAVLAPFGGTIEIGSFCSVNPYTILYGSRTKLLIGDYVRIAAHCVIVPANHTFRNPDLPICFQGGNSKGIVIEDDVWIGANVSVLDGVRIGRGSVIGAGSVVTKNIEPFSVAVGNPAVKIKSRE
jgi:acetyltransferase-like isoleucine patch superfamily enzyme